MQARKDMLIQLIQVNIIEAQKAELSGLETQIFVLHASFDYNNRVWWWY